MVIADIGESPSESEAIADIVASSDVSRQFIAISTILSWARTPIMETGEDEEIEPLEYPGDKLDKEDEEEELDEDGNPKPREPDPNEKWI